MKREIIINSGGFPGDWRVLGDGVSETRAHTGDPVETVGLAPGAYTLQVPRYRGTEVAFRVRNDGVVVLEDAGAPIVGLGASLHFVTRAYEVRPGDADARWAINSGNTRGKGNGTVALLPGASYWFEVLDADGEVLGEGPLSLRSGVQPGTEAGASEALEIRVIALGVAACR